MSENNCAVYVHVNLINGKKYFGITTQEPERRWGKDGKGYSRNEHFTNAINKYGWENFGHFVLYKNIPMRIAKNIEELLIKEHFTHDPRFGYNLTHGGELERRTEKTRKAISRANKGENNPMKRPEVVAKRSKPVEAIDQESGQRVLYFKSTKDAGNAGFHFGHVSECCNGKQRTHAGLIWRWVKEVNDSDSDN